MTRKSRAESSPPPTRGAGKRAVIEVAAGVFKDTCLQLLDEVGGHSVEVIVTKRGEPVARVVAADRRLPSAFGFMRGTVIARRDIVSPDHDAWGDPG